MGTESIVLYKLIVLYMLDRVNFTLTNSQISDFVLEKGYTNYFTLQEAINGLIESEFVYVSSIRGASHYKITYKGEEALSMFENRIPYAIKQDILDFFEKQQLKKVFLLIDIRHVPSENDCMMYDWIVDNGYEPVIICTKLDKIKRSQVQKNLKLIREKLDLVPGTTMIPFSAQTKQGRDEIWNLIEETLAQEQQ